MACQVRVAANVFPHSALVTVPTTTTATLVPSSRSNAVGVSKLHAVPYSTIRLVPHVSTGGVVSTRVMVWLQVLVLLQLSMACQVRVAANVFPHSALVTVPTTTTATLVPSSRSNAVGVSKLHAVPYSTIRLVPHVSTGGVVSTRVMVWLQMLVLLQLSTACQVRVAANVFPHSALVTVPTSTTTTLLPSLRSNAVGVSKLHVMPYSTVRLVPQVSAGGVVSIKVMVWLQVLVLLQLSMACQVRVAAKVFPHSALVTVPRTTTATLAPSFKSNAAGVSKFHVVPYSTIRLVPQVSTCGVVSTRVIV